MDNDKLIKLLSFIVFCDTGFFYEEDKTVERLKDALEMWNSIKLDAEVNGHICPVPMTCNACVVELNNIDAKIILDVFTEEI